MNRIKKGDTVVVVTGRDKGKQGSVLKVIPKEDRLVVQGVNMVKRHSRGGNGQAPGIISKEATIHVSNVALLDPKEGTATRVSFKVLEDGKKVRVARRSGEVID